MYQNFSPAIEVTKTVNLLSAKQKIESRVACTWAATTDINTNAASAMH